jgi:hypothetical protein
VVTQGSEHLFDFENQVYERHQMDGLNPLPFDRTPLVLDNKLILRWPRVGDVFQLIVPISTEGLLVNTKFRTSSLIREIRRADEGHSSGGTGHDHMTAQEIEERRGNLQ